MMETQAYFDNIKEIILAEIGNAKREIYVAVPWFTDGDLLPRSRKRPRLSGSNH